MARMSKDARWAAIHAKAMQQFDASYNATWPDRDAGLEMRRFTDVFGAQWDWDTQGDFQNRMKMQVNEIALACTRIMNEYRKNRISAMFMPKDGSETDALADACAGRFRADTYDALGRQARDQAFDEGLKGGMGAVRLRTEYDDEEKGYQKVCLEPVPDANTTVFFDASSRRKDKSDAGHALLLTAMTPDVYRERFKAEPVSVETKKTKDSGFDWFRPDIVYVAEYFLREKRTDTYRVFRDLNGEEEQYAEAELDDETIAAMLAMGSVEIDSVTVKVDQVRKYTMDGARVLSDDGIIAGRNIPVIPMYAHWSIIDGAERWRAHGQMAKDAQIISNIQLSKVTETAAQSPMEIPIFTPEQIAGHGNRWDRNAIDNYSYMLINPILDINGNPQPAGPIDYTRSPQVAPAVIASMQLSGTMLKELLGNPGNGEVIEPNASGIATQLVQDRIDMQAYGYLDNMADMESRVAEVWLSMASDVYVEKGRKIKTMSADKKRGSVELGKTVLDAKTGKTVTEVDFSEASFDIEVDVGPTSSSKRNATVRAITGMMGVVSDPETMMVLTTTAIMNMEGEGIADVRDWARSKLLSIGAAKPTKEEEIEMTAAAQNQPPNSQDQLAQALAAKSVADAELATARVGEALAKAELTQAQTAETLAGIPISQRKSAIDAAEAIQKGLNPNA